MSRFSPIFLHYILLIVSFSFSFFLENETRSTSSPMQIEPKVLAVYRASIIARGFRSTKANSARGYINDRRNKRRPYGRTFHRSMKPTEELAWYSPPVYICTYLFERSKRGALHRGPHHAILCCRSVEIIVYRTFHRASGAIELTD